MGRGRYWHHENLNDEEIASFESADKAFQQLEDDIQSLEALRSDLIEQLDAQ